MHGDKGVNVLPPLKANSLIKDRYSIVERIGQGGMGSIYRAEDTRLAGRFCAIKEIQIDPYSNEDQQAQAREQFHREASTLARLDHPNLPKVSDFFTDNQRDFLVMDFIPGVDLRIQIEQVKQHRDFLSEFDVLDWANQLCDALHYLHSQNPPIVHRDIKPANIKLTPEGVIKLVDFGLVKLMTPDTDRTITVVQGRGSAHYTPLEQYGGDTGHTETRTDIYSLGATLYHLLTNEPPPEAKERFINPEVLQPLRSYNPAITTRTEQTILWAMGMHPEDRPESIERFRELLMSTGPLDTWSGNNRVRPFIAPVNKVLVIITAGLLLTSVLITLLF